MPGATAANADAAEPPSPCAGKVAQPTLCPTEDTGELYVVGLSKDSGWERGDRLLLSAKRPGLSEPVPVALARVVEHEPGQTAAKVYVVHQDAPVAMDGAIVRHLGKDERGRFGRAVGRVVEVRGSRVRLDVGKSDGVTVDATYELRADNGDSIGKVKITEPADLNAWATVVEQDTPIVTGMDALFLSVTAPKTCERINILVVNFAPTDLNDASDAKAGRVFANELTQALNRNADSGIRVHYENNEQVRPESVEDDGHRAAQAIGKKYNADIVVWGTMRCDQKACARPRFTVVEAAKLQQRYYTGKDLWMARDKAGFKFQGDAPPDPVILATAILGSTSYDAQHYKDAAYYLRRVVRSRVLHGEDQLIALGHLCYALYVDGQTLEARATAEAMRKQAIAAKQAPWKRCAESELARLDILEGKVTSARKRLAAIRTEAEKLGESGNLSYALSSLADLEKLQGRPDQARKFYDEALQLEKSIGDVQGQAATLHALGILESDQGRPDQARKFYDEALKLEKSIGDVQDQAHTLHVLGMLESDQGRPDQARKFYDEALKLEKSIGDVQGQAATLHALGILESAQGRPDQARKSYEESLQLDKSIGEVSGIISTELNLAVLDYGAGKKQQAKQKLKKLLGDARSRQYVDKQASILDWLGWIQAQEGDATGARAYWQQAKQLYQQLRMNNEAQEVQGKIDGLAPAAQTN